ncbi:ANTAR domain-containing protein OS=Streptomyces alboniger OX=132473 GN=CP975_30350 PE=4 SV=1 [Streptomyces alboniger]
MAPLPDPDLLRPGSALPGRRLSELAEQAVRCTPGCCGAGTTVSDGGDEHPASTTHPDLAGLVAAQLRSGEGPIPAAEERGTPVESGDLLREERWPEYRALALDAGLRASVTLPFRRAGLTVTLTVFGFRAGTPTKPGTAPPRRSALCHGGFVRDRHHRAALTELDQLGTAMRSRAAVDQACGIVMHVLGCEAEAAFAVLRRVSQATNRKLADVAAALVETKGRGLERELVSLAR